MNLFRFEFGSGKNIHKLINANKWKTIISGKKRSQNSTNSKDNRSNIYGNQCKLSPLNDEKSKQNWINRNLIALNLERTHRIYGPMLVPYTLSQSNSKGRRFSFFYLECRKWIEYEQWKHWKMTRIRIPIRITWIHVVYWIHLIQFDRLFISLICPMNACIRCCLRSTIPFRRF